MHDEPLPESAKSEVYIGVAFHAREGVLRREASGMLRGVNTFMWLRRDRFREHRIMIRDEVETVLLGRAWHG